MNLAAIHNGLHFSPKQMLQSAVNYLVMAGDHPNLADVPLTAIMHALSDPVRLQIVRKAADGGELACCDFGLELAKATLSHHFKVLREAGLIQMRSEGTHKMTSLRRRDLDERFPGLMAAVLNAPDLRPLVATSDELR